MDWIPLASTAVGAALALAGSLLAYTLRDRHERDRDNLAERRQCYLDFVLALERTHGDLRQVAEPGADRDGPRPEAYQAYRDNGVYEARERLLMTGSRAVITAGERTVRSLGQLRDAVADGVKLHTIAFHDRYHDFAGAIWHLRATVRADLGSAELSPADFDKQGWDDKANCAFCNSNAAEPTAA